MKKRRSHARGPITRTKRTPTGRWIVEATYTGGVNAWRDSLMRCAAALFNTHRRGVAKRVTPGGSGMWMQTGVRDLSWIARKQATAEAFAGLLKLFRGVRVKIRKEVE